MIPIYFALKGAIVGLDHTIQNYAPHLTYLRAERFTKVAILPIKDIEFWKISRNRLWQGFELIQRQMIETPLRPYPIDILFHRSQHTLLEKNKFMLKNGVVWVIKEVRGKGVCYFAENVKSQLKREAKHRQYIERSIQQKELNFLQRLKSGERNTYDEKRNAFLEKYMAKQRKLNYKLEKLNPILSRRTDCIRNVSKALHQGLLSFRKEELEEDDPFPGDTQETERSEIQSADSAIKKLHYSDQFLPSQISTFKSEICSAIESERPSLDLDMSPCVRMDRSNFRRELNRDVSFFLGAR